MTLPWITAHTGCMNTPDNSVKSLLAGLNSAAEIVEVDVGATKDGVAILAHDSKLRLAARGECRLADITYEELAADSIVDHHTGNDRKIVRLEEILPMIKQSGKQVNLDLKSDSCIEPMARLVQQAEMLEQVILSGAEAERAAYLERNYPMFRKLLNANGKLFRETDYTSAIRQTCEDALAAKCIGININHTLCHSELISYASARSLPVYVWTVNDAEEIRRMIQLGVKSITTRDVPAVVQEFQS